MRTETPQTIYLKDYTPFPFTVESIDLTFKIFDDKTIVRAVTVYERNIDDNLDLVLNGEHLELLSVTIDGIIPKYEINDTTLTIKDPGESFTLITETEIDPASNTRLEGLYKSGGNWCTQCEAEGFRTITYFPDRPDVMTVFTVRLEADKKTCPVLLSNGNLVEDGKIDDNRHYTVWHDPFPKPCYLFALVAGDLVHIQDEFTTMSGRKVDLRIYVREGDEKQCDHAMDSLKRSMKWDEEKYGREYELDRFNIVAVSDFNMGAMENTSLNIFNTALVLAHQDTATDHDFERVEGVIAHEYFHNWTGNRVTCRDWFQLSLKEGLTVFRDQQFSGDMNSEKVQRINDVVMLRRRQFAEDAGPLAHPVRPDNYIEINNFYTVTVYEKGAEVIRMQHTLLGPEKYREATDLYFERFDGQAVTCEDFVRCMEEVAGNGFGQFFLWYKQAGTPIVTAKGQYDEKNRRYTLTLSQDIPDTPGQKDKKPMHIPVKVGLVGSNGDDMAEKLLELTEKEQSFTFENIPSKPVPSILRGFSAPVKLQTDLTHDDLRFLMVHDNDGFNRWEAGQTYSLKLLNGLIDARELGKDGDIWPDFLDSYDALLDQALHADTDKAMAAKALAIPDIPMIAQDREKIDPSLIHECREKLVNRIAEKFSDKLHEIYKASNDKKFSMAFEARARRSLKNTVLDILSDTDLAKTQYDNAHNMTDRVAALSVLADSDVPARAEAFADYYKRFEDHELVINKWFSLQAMANRPDVLDDITSLKEHAAFNATNPNRVRALFAAFAMNNPVWFHHESGKGYEHLATMIRELNEINPQIASRLLTPLKDWRRYTPERQKLIKARLEDLSKMEDISPDVYEIVTKSLKE